VSKDERILLFLKKKKQKDFYSVVARAPYFRRNPVDRWHPPRSAYKSLFASFSSEKEDSSCLFLLPSHPQCP
jgi:hypothetical protein